VLEAIRTFGLELQVIFNKGSVMILPSGVNKATGLKRTLKVLGIPPEEVIGVGDAENDHALLEFCGLSAAVANALPALKERANLVLASAHGEGVTELIGLVLGGPTREASKRNRV
jgi:hydroxymethylpyrimidine pyrophosphatase-like HAD family hydrolase